MTNPKHADAKTYMTTEQFIEVWKSLDDDKRKELSAAWDTAWNNAWYTVRDANLAVLVRDKITTKQFEILTQPWTSCQLSLFAEDWQRLQQSEVEK